MLKTRVIPCLLLKDFGLVKTQKFKDPKYLGDPLNAVRIFNEKEVDELVFLDISATREKRKPHFDIITEIASECFMPLGYGGGINSLNDLEELFYIGIEKAIINSHAIRQPTFIEEAAKRYGNQSIVVSIDVKKNMFGKYEVLINGGKERTKINPINHAVNMESLGAGELIINSINYDGMMEGYDIELVKMITSNVSIPVVAMGGAGNLSHFADAIHRGNASAVAAGSLFVFQGKHRAVLINYPSSDELEKAFSEKQL